MIWRFRAFLSEPDSPCRMDGDFSPVHGAPVACSTPPLEDGKKEVWGCVVFISPIICPLLSFLNPLSFLVSVSPNGITSLPPSLPPSLSLSLFLSLHTPPLFHPELSQKSFKGSTSKAGPTGNEIRRWRVQCPRMTSQPHYL